MPRAKPKALKGDRGYGYQYQSCAKPDSPTSTAHHAYAAES
jgi:hypothetical protein